MKTADNMIKENPKEMICVSPESTVYEALQMMNEKHIGSVFVKEGEEYRFAPLTLGRSDGKYIEVISGIRAGQEYVSKNSYLIKADIEKSEAEHEH